MSKLEDLVARAETILGSRGPQWESEAEDVIRDLVAAMKDDIVAIKEYAPKYLGKRVDQYRKRTHTAEGIVDDARETLEGYSRWWDGSPEDSWRLERDLRVALQMPKLEEHDG